MAGRRYNEDEIRSKLAQAEEMLGAGQSIASVARSLGVSASTLGRWRRSVNSSSHPRPEENDKLRKDESDVSDDVVALRAELARLRLQWAHLVRIVSIAGLAVVVAAFFTIAWSPWNSTARSAQNASMQYDNAEKAFLTCSRGVESKALAACYTSYARSVAAIAWPSQIQLTATAITGAAGALALELTTGRSTVDTIAQMASEQQELTTALDVLTGNG